MNYEQVLIEFDEILRLLGEQLPKGREEIVRHFLDYGEAAIAAEHLFDYTVCSDLAMQPSLVVRLEKLLVRLGVEVVYPPKEGLSTSEE